MSNTPDPRDYPYREAFYSLDQDAPIRAVTLEPGAWPGGLMAELLRDEPTLARCAAAFRLLVETARKDLALH